MPETLKRDAEGYYPSDPIRSPKNNQDRVYPCIRCGTLRSQDEGGTTFTLCDKCWDKKYPKPAPDGGGS